MWWDGGTRGWSPESLCKLSGLWCRRVGLWSRIFGLGPKRSAVDTVREISLSGVGGKMNCWGDALFEATTMTLVRL